MQKYHSSKLVFVHIGQDGHIPLLKSKFETCCVLVISLGASCSGVVWPIPPVLTVEFSRDCRGISAEEANGEGHTPIALACQTGRHENVKLLLEKARGQQCCFVLLCSCAKFLFFKPIPVVWKGLRKTTQYVFCPSWEKMKFLPNPVLVSAYLLCSCRARHGGGVVEQEGGTGRCEQGAQVQLVPHTLRRGGRTPASRQGKGEANTRNRKKQKRMTAI